MKKLLFLLIFQIFSKVKANTLPPHFPDNKSKLRGFTRGFAETIENAGKRQLDHLLNVPIKEKDLEEKQHQSEINTVNDGTIEINSVETFHPAINQDGYAIDYCCRYEVISNENSSSSSPEWNKGIETLNQREQLGYGCGKEAADRFCQSKGYEEADNYDVIYYSHEPTYVVGEDRVQEPDESLGLGHHTFFNFINCHNK